MRSFRTLRGFLSGDEPDEPIRFACSATLRIFGEHLDFDEIGRQLGVTPTRVHRTGERKGADSPPFATDMWVFSPPVPEDRPLGEHIDALWNHIQHAEHYLHELKQEADVGVFLGYRSNHDHAGVEVSHTSLEMFIRLQIPFGLSIVVV